MKTIKTFLIIAGLALTSIGFGQLLSHNDNEVLFYTAHFNRADMRMEHQVNQYPARSTSGDYFEAPVFTRAYFVPVNFDLGIESWMTSPFESSFYEEEVQIESWMESPFDGVFFELDPSIETWMTLPFESGEEIIIEDWMTSPWI